MEPTTSPPIIPAITPAKSGAPLAKAIPKHKGNATKKTTTLEGRSLFKCLNIKLIYPCSFRKEHLLI
jgi:hypothetical protein